MNSFNPFAAILLIALVLGASSIFYTTSIRDSRLNQFCEEHGFEYNEWSQEQKDRICVTETTENKEFARIEYEHDFMAIVTFRDPITSIRFKKPYKEVATWTNQQ